MTPVPTIAFATLGCKTNQAETVRLLGQLQQDLAVVPFEQGADIYVINTCTVTHEADRQSRQLIRRAHRANPDAAIVVTGCAVDYASDAIAQLPGVRLAALNSQKDRLAEIVASWYSLTLPEEKPIGPGAEGQNTRAWLKVSEGCNNNCSFCIIPEVRGAERSLEAVDLVAQACRLAAAGYREVVLTGTNIGSYGRDGRSGLDAPAWRGAARGATLAPLVGQLVAAAPAIRRWRISSIEPIDFPDDLVRLYGRPEVCPHVHLCLQSGSDAVLARMRRRYNTDMFRRLVERLRAERPGITLTTDVIVGFPGETEEDFGATLDFLRGIQFSGAHLFPYSDRSGTHAEALDSHVPRGEIGARMDRAETVVRELHQTWCESWVGKTAEVLVERVGETYATGTTEHYLKVRLPADGLLGNSLVPVRITGAEGGVALASPI